MRKFIIHMSSLAVLRKVTACLRGVGWCWFLHINIAGPDELHGTVTMPRGDAVTNANCDNVVEVASFLAHAELIQKRS